MRAALDNYGEEGLRACNRFPCKLLQLCASRTPGQGELTCLRATERRQLRSAGQYPFSGLRETATALTLCEPHVPQVSFALKAETFSSAENRAEFM